MRWLIIGLVLLATPLWAGNIQYLVATGEVTGGSNEPVPVPSGYAIVTIPESVTQITWPVPMGCPAGTGTAEYTRIETPGDVTVTGGGMVVRPDLVFLTSSSPLATSLCVPVTSAEEVWQAVNDTLYRAIAATDRLPVVNQLNVAAARLCPTTDVSQECVAVRAAISVLNAVIGRTPTTLKAFLEAAVQLQADAAALITLHNW